MTDELKMNPEAEAEAPKPEGAEAEEPKTPFGAFLYHQRKAAEATLKAVGALIPPDVRKYSREAAEEHLKSFRSLIDGARSSVNDQINRVKKEREQNDNRPPTTGKTKVKVEVN
jgi:hypothetical protein